MKIISYVTSFIVATALSLTSATASAAPAFAFTPKPVVKKITQTVVETVAQTPRKVVHKERKAPERFTPCERVKVCGFNNFYYYTYIDSEALTSFLKDKKAGDTIVMQVEGFTPESLRTYEYMSNLINTLRVLAPDAVYSIIGRALDIWNGCENNQGCIMRNNWSLSKDRAFYVKNQLKSAGLKTGRINWIGHGVLYHNDKETHFNAPQRSFVLVLKLKSNPQELLDAIQKTVEQEADKSTAEKVTDKKTKS